jgi:hypothetical protein
MADSLIKGMVIKVVIRDKDMGLNVETYFVISLFNIALADGPIYKL